MQQPGKLTVEAFEALFPDRAVELFRAISGPKGAREWKWHAAWSARCFDPDDDGRLVDPQTPKRTFGGATPEEALFALAIGHLDDHRRMLQEAQQRAARAHEQAGEHEAQVAALRAALGR